MKHLRTYTQKGCGFMSNAAIIGNEKESFTGMCQELIMIR
jgi:hypothetical protein